MTLIAPLTTLPAELLNNPALVYWKVSSTQTCAGATRNGIQWTEGKTIAPVQVDGARNPIQTMQRIASYDAKLAFTLLQAGTEAQLQRLQPGATSADGTDPVTKTISMQKAGSLLVAANYLTDVYVIWPLADASLVAIHIPIGLVTKADFNGAADGEAEIPVEIQAVSPASDPNKCPFTYELLGSTWPAASGD